MAQFGIVVRIIGLEGTEPSQLAPGLPPVLRGGRAVSNVEAIESTRDKARPAPSQPEHRSDAPKFIQSMLYTSGTTGVPKGVRRFAPTAEQKLLMQETRRSVYGVTPHVRLMIPGPLYHGAPHQPMAIDLGS